MVIDNPREAFVSMLLIPSVNVLHGGALGHKFCARKIKAIILRIGS